MAVAGRVPHSRHPRAPGLPGWLRRAPPSHSGCSAEGSAWHLRLGWEAVGAVSPNTSSSLGAVWVENGVGSVPRSSVPCSAPQLSLEEPIETAILLSLVGVRSIVANQWLTPLQDNALRASLLWESECAQPAPAPQKPTRAMPI